MDVTSFTAADRVRDPFSRLLSAFGRRADEAEAAIGRLRAALARADVDAGADR